MSAVTTNSAAEWAVQVASERAGREQAEAALAAAQAEIAMLKQEAAASASRARQHHTQLTALVQNLRVGFVLVDSAGQIQYVNEHFWSLFGLPPVAGPAEGHGPIPLAAVHIDDAFRDPATFRARALALHAAGQTVLQEEFVLRSGRVVELDYLVLETEGAGRLICYRDVTERHQRDAEIQTLSSLPQHNPNPILRLSPAGEVLYANLAAQPLLPALAADAPAGLLARLLAMVSAVLRTPEQPPQEVEINGRYYLLTGAAMPDQAFVTLYFTNITARQQAEGLLAEQRAFFDSLLEQVPTAVAVFDAEHRYLFLNPALEPNATTRAWMVGKTSIETCVYRKRPEAVAQRRAAAFAEAVREQRDVSWEETWPSSQGRQHWWLRYRPVVAANGEQLVLCSGVDITERKMAEEKVAEQQEFYESVLNLLPVDVAVFDAQHRFLFVNPSAVSDAALRQQITGLTSAEYFAIRKDKLPASLAKEREQYFELATRTRTDVTWEEMRTDRNQQPQLMLRYFRPVYDASGALRLMVGAGIDITARYTAEKLQHQVQEMLQMQQTFVRHIINTLPNALYMVAPDDSVTFSNHAYDVISAQYQRRHVAEVPVAVAEEMKQLRDMNELVRSTRQAQTRELTFTHDEGEVLHFQVHKRPMERPDGQMDILTVSTDISDTKRARQALERREKQYHDLVYYSQALICTHDLQGTLLSVNPAIERLLGIPAAQLVGKNLSEALPPKHRAALKAYFEGENPLKTEDQIIEVQTREGELRYLRYYTYQVAQEGHAPYVLASGYDVTPAIMAERALRLAKQEAEENALAKEAFLARMSHEIRTPLNGVLGMAGLLQKTSLTAPQREYLTTMQHAGQHLLALLNDVLDMAKITTHHHHVLNHAPFDLGVALHGAGQTVAALLAQKGLALTVEPLPAAMPRVLGDAYRLHQVLLNLLSNAIKFTDYGHVRLGAEVLEDTPQALRLRFYVEDTGIGISPEEQVHIFEAFAQASADTSLRYGGTGLGLTISRQLVEQMGGALQLSSVPGEGTTFSFQLVLPRAPDTAGDHVPAAPTAGFEALQGLRVLLAEDNLVNQRIAVAVLEYWGVHVHAVDNGSDALAQLQEHVYDAAILDIRMPGLSGVQVTTAIRLHPAAKLANIPIIALTANAFEADRAAYLAAGMNACLTKPYDEAALCQLLLDLTAAK
ncbi:PAS domain S-box protein [Hymenobacter glacialis]|uniref:histidine kinase n=1 Tax=Hymenobacter glacialis TaxID=1908236 RepID=A0A1G1T161_9BACT|nr:PAS domain S-box protein [Hymenobacter glacialis]OGX84609.1 hypothetical protein BEN48_02400 [Hymenobacter glacialis]